MFINEAMVSKLFPILLTNFHSNDLLPNSISNCSILNTGQENHEVNSSKKQRNIQSIVLFFKPVIDRINHSHREIKLHFDHV